MRARGIDSAIAFATIKYARYGVRYCHQKEKISKIVRMILTASEELLVLGFVVAGVPSVGTTVFANFNHENNLSVVILLLHILSSLELSRSR